jgi:hypothetical protein
LAHQRSRQRQPLLLTPGQLRRHPFLIAAKLNLTERVGNFFPNVGAAYSLLANPQGEGYILENREVRPNGIALKDHTNGPAIGRHKSAIGRRKNFTPGHYDFSVVRLFEPRDASERGRFTAPRRAQQRIKAPLLDSKGNIVDRLDAGIIAIGVNLNEGLDLDHE